MSEDGKRISGAKGLLAIFPLVWITEVEAEKFRSRPNDPILAPIVPYPMQPAKQGKLVRTGGRCFFKLFFNKKMPISQNPHSQTIFLNLMHKKRKTLNRATCVCLILKSHNLIGFHQRSSWKWQINNWQHDCRFI